MARSGRAKRFGAVVQGILLGPGLVLAILWLTTLAGDTLPFRYQGF